MFLVRAAFWLSVVVVLLPADKDTGNTAPRVTAFEALSAARTTVGDLSQFCQRNPDVCVTGGSAFAIFGDKARYAVKLLYRTFGNHKATDTAAGGTLKPDDIKPAWHAPKPAKPAGAA